MSSPLNLRQIIEEASIDQIIDLLKKAQVIAADFGGKQIHVQGYVGYAFFSDFEKKIDQLFQEQLKHEKQEQGAFTKLFLRLKGKGEKEVEKHSRFETLF